MDFDFLRRSKEVVKITEIKWEARKKNEIPIFPPKKIFDSRPTFYPRQLQELLNLKTALCPVCRKRLNSSHLREAHCVVVPENAELLAFIEAEGREKGKKKGMKKVEIIKELGGLLNPYISCMKQILNM